MTSEQRLTYEFGIGYIAKIGLGEETHIFKHHEEGWVNYHSPTITYKDKEVTILRKI